jgi:hypothetical protein
MAVFAPASAAFLETVPWAATFYHFTKRKAVDQPLLTNFDL